MFHKMNSDITLCLTIGLRPDLLKQTLSSLSDNWRFGPVIAINDFRDEPTNQMFKELCPNGHLISLDQKLGHHRAVDHMYEHVRTPYVFHCEDDWNFDTPVQPHNLLDILKKNESISQVCVRKISDFNFSDHENSLISNVHDDNLDYFCLSQLHDQWHGYTFNPHIASLDIWRSLGGFSKFKKERHISRELRNRGLFTAYLNPGACFHIGELHSVSPSVTKPTKFQLFRKHIKGLFI